MTENKFLAQGSYGCAYRPSFRCSSGPGTPMKPKDKYIGKIFMNPNSAKEEWKSSRFLEEIDPKGSLFLYPAHMCDVDLNEIMKSVDSYKCSHVSPIIKKYKQLLMRYGGLKLESYMIAWARDNPRILSRANLIYSLSYIFYGIKKLLKHGYIHQDIKSDNIVISDNGIRLIDFGLITNDKSFYTKNNSFFTYMASTPYAIHPTEYRFHHILTSDKPDITSFIEREYKLLDRYIPISYDFIKRNITEMYLFVKKWQDENKDVSVMRLFEEHKIHEKSDIYSLGCVLLRLRDFCIPEKYDNKNYVKLFNEIIGGMITPNVFRRMDINTLIRKINILKKGSVVVFTKPYDNIELDDNMMREFWENVVSRSSVSNKCAKDKMVFDPVSSKCVQKKQCPPGKVINPITGRCIKEKENVKKTKDCPPGKIINPLTGRCIKEKLPNEQKVKECPSGKVVNPLTGRCIKIKAPKGPKECPPGKVINPLTGRCVKQRS